MLWKILALSAAILAYAENVPNAAGMLVSNYSDPEGPRVFALLAVYDADAWLESTMFRAEPPWVDEPTYTEVQTALGNRLLSRPFHRCDNASTVFIPQGLTRYNIIDSGFLGLAGAISDHPSAESDTGDTSNALLVNTPGAACSIEPIGSFSVADTALNRLKAEAVEMIQTSISKSAQRRRRQAEEDAKRKENFLAFAKRLEEYGGTPTEEFFKQNAEFIESIGGLGVMAQLLSDSEYLLEGRPEPAPDPDFLPELYKAPVVNQGFRFALPGGWSGVWIDVEWSYPKESAPKGEYPDHNPWTAYAHVIVDAETGNVLWEHVDTQENIWGNRTYRFLGACDLDQDELPEILVSRLGHESRAYQLLRFRDGAFTVVSEVAGAL